METLCGIFLALLCRQEAVEQPLQGPPEERNTQVIAMLQGAGQAVDEHTCETFITACPAIRIFQMLPG